MKAMFSLFSLDESLVGVCWLDACVLVCLYAWASFKMEKAMEDQGKPEQQMLVSYTRAQQRVTFLVIQVGRVTQPQTGLQ